MVFNKISGINLLELVVTVAIISMLSAAAIPTYQKYVVRSKISSVMPIMDGFKTKIIKDHNYGVVYGNTSEDLIPANATNKPEYLYSLVRGEYGCIEAEFDLDQMGIRIDTNSELTLVLCPVTASAANTDAWVCGYSSSTSSEYFNYFPLDCKQEITPDTSF